MYDIHAEYRAESVAFLQDLRKRDQEFRERLEAAQKPFGLRDYLIMAGFAVLFVSAAIGVGTLLASLSH